MNIRPLNLQQTEHVQAWRAVALELMPYMASMLFSLRFVDAPGLGTFAVDKHHRCYIDFDAVTEKGPSYCGQALLHECSHLFGAHAAIGDELGVTGGQMAKVLNLASDASIDDDLRDAGLPIFADGAGHVTPSTIGEPDYQTVQHYFRALTAKMAKQKPQTNGGQGRPGPDGHGQQASQGGQVQQTGPYKGCGSGSGGQAAPGELDDGDDLDGAATPATGTEQERVRISTATAIREAAAKGRGTVPGGLLEQAEQILTPSKVPWQKVLGRQMRGSVRSRIGTMDVSYARRNRRRHNERVITADGTGHRLVIPAHTDPTPRIHIIRDTSGSMTNDDLAKVTSEVVAIAKKIRVRGDDLLITDVDATAYASKGFTNARSMGTVTGRGGTDMCVGITHALAAKPKPTVIVVMTDGWTPWPSQQTRIPVIAVIIGKHPEQAAEGVPSWIRTVTVETV